MDNSSSIDEIVRTRNCIEQDITQSGFGIIKIIRFCNPENYASGFESPLEKESWLVLSSNADNGKLKGFLTTAGKRHHPDLVFYKDRTVQVLCSESDDNLQNNVVMDLGHFSGLKQIALYFSLLHQDTYPLEEFTEKIEFFHTKSFFSRCGNTICSFTYKAQK